MQLVKYIIIPIFLLLPILSSAYQPSKAKVSFACMAIDTIDPFLNPSVTKGIINEWHKNGFGPLTDQDLMQLTFSGWMNWGMTYIEDSCRHQPQQWGMSFLVSSYPNAYNVLHIRVTAQTPVYSIPMTNVFIRTALGESIALNIPLEFAAKPLEAGEFFEFTIHTNEPVISSEVVVLGATLQYNPNILTGYGFDKRLDWEQVVSQNETTWGRIKRCMEDM